jgi:hypothetical protein
MLSDLMVHDIVLERLEASGKSQLYGTPVTIKGFLQALDTEDALQADGIFVLSYKLYTEPSTDIKEGDRVTILGDKYNVKSVVKYQYPDETAHNRSVVVKIVDV